MAVPAGFGPGFCRVKIGSNFFSNLRQLPKRPRAASESVQMSGHLHGSGNIASRPLKQANETTPIISGMGFAEAEAAFQGTNIAQPDSP
jgi:hypothetical protein